MIIWLIYGKFFIKGIVERINNVQNKETATERQGRCTEKKEAKKKERVGDWGGGKERVVRTNVERNRVGGVTCWTKGLDPKFDVMSRQSVYFSGDWTLSPLNSRTRIETVTDAQEPFQNLRKILRTVGALLP